MPPLEPCVKALAMVAPAVIGRASETTSLFMTIFYFLIAFICTVGATYNELHLHQTLGWWIGFIIFSLLGAKSGSESSSHSDSQNEQEISTFNEVAEQSSPESIAGNLVTEPSVGTDNRGFNIAVMMSAVLIVVGCLEIYSDISKVKSWPFIPSLIGIFSPVPLIVFYLLGLFIFVVLLSVVFEMTIFNVHTKYFSSKTKESAASDYGALGSFGMNICLLGSVVIIIYLWYSSFSVANRYNELFGTRRTLLGVVDTVQYDHSAKTGHVVYSTYMRRIRFISGDLMGDGVEYETNVDLPGYDKSIEYYHMQIELLTSWLGSSVIAIKPLPVDSK
jgi:hypothetical protein